MLKYKRLGEGTPRVRWTPIEALDISGKKGRIKVGGRSFNLEFDDALDLVHALEKVGLIAKARMLPPQRRSAVVSRKRLAIERVEAGERAIAPEPPPQGLEDCYYLGVWTAEDRWDNWIFYLEDAYIVLHRMNRLLQGLHPRGAAAAVRAALATIH